MRSTAICESTGTRQATWFMDYRNPDGSLGRMCGNGIRVLARYLVDAGYCPPGTFDIDTRAGPRTVHVPYRSADFDGAVTVHMGHPRLPGPAGITVTTAARTWDAVHVDMGNPHAVALVDDLAHPGDLATPPTVRPPGAYPHGTTVEFVVRQGPRDLALRIHERGAGETAACGTGACAAVAGAHPEGAPPGSYTVHSSGGRLRVTVHRDGSMSLTGPATIVAHGLVQL